MSAKRKFSFPPMDKADALLEETGGDGDALVQVANPFWRNWKP